MKHTDELQSEKDYIQAYSNNGYTQNFYVKDGELINPDRDISYNATDISVVAEHRFEGASNPDDMSILYVIIAMNEDKGTMLVNYSPTNATETAEFFKLIPKENYSQKNNILRYKN